MPLRHRELVDLDPQLVVDRPRWLIGMDHPAGVVAAADVDLGAVLDDVVGEGAWQWHRRNEEAARPGGRQ